MIAPSNLKLNKSAGSASEGAGVIEAILAWWNKMRAIHGSEEDTSSNLFKRCAGLTADEIKIFIESIKHAGVSTTTRATCGSSAFASVASISVLQCVAASISSSPAHTQACFSSSCEFSGASSAANTNSSTHASAPLFQTSAASHDVEEKVYDLVSLLLYLPFFYFSNAFHCISEHGIFELPKTEAAGRMLATSPRTPEKQQKRFSESTHRVALIR